jgi:membrane associated rhomboid family serine protease
MKLCVFIAIVFTYVTCVWSFALHRHSAILRKNSGQVIRPYLNVRPNLNSYNHHIDSLVKLSAVKHTNQRFNPQTAENKITSGTSALIATNVFVYVMSLYDPKLISGFMKLNSRISKGETYRLLTSTFLHTDRYHLAMNCYSLYNMGKMVFCTPIFPFRSNLFLQAESVFGREKFLAIFLGSGAIANTITFALDTAPEAIGASDCICGIMGAMGMYAYRNKGRLGSGADSRECSFY